MSHIRRLLSVGSVVADVRISVPFLPPRGGDVLASAACLSAGGGFNILAAAARQGLPTLFAGRHGSGPYGTRIRAELAREGITILLPASPEADSGFCMVLVEPDGERTFISSPGVEAALGERSLATVPLSPGDAVFVSGYDLCYPELGVAIAAWASSLPPDVVLVIDPGPLAGDIPAKLLDAVMPRATIWTMNRREAGLLTGCQHGVAVRDRLRPGLSPEALLIIRDGAAGATLSASARDDPIRVASPAVTMVDSTGAGDAHTGVLIASLAQGLDPAAAVARANAAAALSVTSAGPATAPGRAELEQFLQTHPHSSSFPSPQTLA